MSCVIAIPARLHSTRLDRKLLADLGGRSVLRRTHDVALRAKAGRVVVLADDQEIAAEVRSFGGEVILTERELDSGTARIASVIDDLDAEIVVNLQGDAPLTDPAVVTRSAEEARRSGAAVTMPVHRLRDPRELADPSVIKVVRAHDGRALYCSRSPLPHVRDADPDDWPAVAQCWAHPGIYAYSRGFLTGFGGLAASGLERAERLEQLRWLQAGLHVHTFEVDPQPPSVDTLEQLERVRAELDRRQG